MNIKIDDWSIRSSAIFSEDGQYRYYLERVFAEPKDEHNKLVFIMLNPSTADEKVADPTVRRCMVYATDWGADRLSVLNLFALRSTDPKALYSHPDPVGVENDYWIEKTVAKHEDRVQVVCAWGEHGAYRYRGAAVLELLKKLGVTPWYLRLNASGQPAHPLYLPKSLLPTRFM